MSISDTTQAKRYASVAEVAAAQCQLFTEEARKAPEYTNLAKQYAENSEASSIAAQASRDQAAQSANGASSSASAAQVSANSASSSSQSALSSAQTASSASESATASASSAENSAQSASEDAQIASDAVTKTLRVSDSDISPLAAAADRANKVLSCDASGNFQFTAPASGSAQDVLNQLAEPAGAELVGYTQGIAGSINRTVTEKLGDVISVKDFGASGDGVTDDTAIIQALFDLLSDANVPQPTNNNYTVVFPSGVYKISSIVVGRRTNLRFEGGRLEPLDTTTPRTHLIKFYGGYNKVYNLCVNMNYATNYDTVIWCRTRYLDFIAPEIWSAKCVWTFGDPSWKNDPAGGILGDSEIQIIGGWSIWCITHHKAYGVNTIVQFVGHECYSYKWSLPDGDPRKSSWESQPEITGYNCGALIYLTGSFTGNYSGQQPNFLSQLQVTSTSDYKNTYGRYVLSGTHVETGYLFKCEAAPSGIVAEDDYTQMLNVVNCTGYVSGGRSGYFIDASEALQSIGVINSNFYGNIVDRVLYSLGSKIHVSRGSFPKVSGGDIFKAIQARSFYNYDVYNPFNVSTSSQYIGGSLTALRMSNLESSDLDAAFVASYYDSATGNFTFPQDVFNVEVAVNLLPTSGASTDSTDIALYINGGQDMLLNSMGSTPSAVFKIKKITSGSVIQIRVVSYNSRTLSGSDRNKISITCSC